MSGIAGLYNVAGDLPDFLTWSFIHAAHHRDINRIIFQLAEINMAEFVLDPFNPADAGEWLQNHQTMHQQMDAILGIEGYNLLAVDMTNRDQFASWVALNADEHLKAANLLGFG